MRCCTVACNFPECVSVNAYVKVAWRGRKTCACTLSVLKSSSANNHIHRWNRFFTQKPKWRHRWGIETDENRISHSTRRSKLHERIRQSSSISSNEQATGFGLCSSKTFSKFLYIPVPDERNRRDLLKHFLRNNAHTLGSSDINRLALLTEGYSGSDLKFSISI